MHHQKEQLFVAACHMEHVMFTKWHQRRKVVLFDGVRKHLVIMT